MDQCRHACSRLCHARNGLRATESEEIVRIMVFAGDEEGNG